MGDQNFKKVKTVLWIILFANFLVAGIKIVLGYFIKSRSLTADGFHSLTDGTSNVVGLIGIYFASKPVDEGHPYGHKKIETLTGLFIAGMLIILGGNVFSGAIRSFSRPMAPEVGLESILTLTFTLAVNILVARYELKQGKKLHSCILVSDSMHTRSDIYVSIGVLMTLTGIRLGLPALIDPIVSIIVGGFIIYAAFKILLPTLGVLSDKAVIAENIIREVVCSFDQVKNVHKIRSRGRLDDIHLDLHIMMDPSMSVEQSHRLIHDIEAKIAVVTGQNINAVIHVEPYYEE